MQKIIVDGYNVIHATPRLRRRAERGLQQARDELVAILSSYTARRAVRITVVFDGTGHLVDAEAPVPGRLQVLYSAAGQSADALIVAALRAASNPREFIVVTSDMADIGRAARSLGATVVASRAFIERLMGAGDGGGDSAPTDHAAGEPTDDVDYWLGRFERRDRGGGQKKSE